jgi:hypothetical protein
MRHASSFRGTLTAVIAGGALLFDLASGRRAVTSVRGHVRFERLRDHGASRTRHGPVHHALDCPGHGRIWATRNPDRGLTVHIELPCEEVA